MKLLFNRLQQTPQLFDSFITECSLCTLAHSLPIIKWNEEENIEPTISANKLWLK